MNYLNKEDLIMAHPITPARFALGKLLVTPRIASAYDSGTLLHCLACHANGDWGIISDDDWEINDANALDGGALFSAYRENGKELWIITEYDHSVTTILFPDEY